VDLAFQDFARELGTLSVIYGPPEGVLILAYDGVDPAGCVGVRARGPGTAELKRLFVRPAHRGRGLGRTLVQEAVAFARAAGHERLVLDTLGSMSEALGLYRSLGFRDCPPYYANPLPDVVYLSLQLRE
jgi:putative acetyltransferase